MCIIMKTTNIVSVCILAALLLSSVGCGETGAETETAAGGTAAETLSRETESPYPDSIPLGLDFGGRSVKLHAGLFNEHVKDPMSHYSVEAETGDIVNDAVYRRNQTVEERFNCSLVYDGLEFDYGGRMEEMNYVTNSLMAGDNAFDAVFEIVHLLPSYITSGALYDMHDMKYIDLEAPWWMQKYNAVAERNGNLYFAVGDITMGIYYSPYAFFFNKQLINDLDLEDPYALVRDGKWTVDQLIAMSKAGYADLNGNSKVDAEDRLGCVIQSGNEIQGFIESCGVSFITVGADGTAEYTFGCEHNTEVVDKLYRLLYETEGSLYVGKQVTPDQHQFCQGQTVFNGSWLTAMDYYRELNFDFGLIPYPKYDEAQTAYATHLGTACPAVCVPVTCSDPDAVSAVLEALASEGYRTLRTAYFDTALKEKYSRDEDTKEMIDLLISGISVDFGDIYVYTLSGLTDEFKNLLGGRSRDLASIAAKLEKNVNAKLEELLAALG